MLDKISNRYNDSVSRKIVIRRLPPHMDVQTFKKQISPIPEHDYMYYVQADKNYGTYSFSRAYINFLYEDDLYLFKEKFDNYVFLDSKGNFIFVSNRSDVILIKLFVAQVWSTGPL